MRKIFVFMMVSLDGFFEGPDHELDWHNVDAEFNEFAAGQLNEVDTLFFGWRTYELMAGYWPTEAGKQDSPVIAEKMNAMQKIAFSRKERKVEWRNTRLIKGNVGGEVTKLKNQPGKDIAIFGSSNLCVSLIQMGLIDEFRIMVNPVVLGKGHTLFNGINEKLNLRLLKTRTFNSGNVLLYYKNGSFLSQDEVKAMIKLSTPSDFRLGKELFDKGEIEIIEFTGNKIIANIGDGQRRKIEFLSSSNRLQWNCTCKRNQDKFCKHAVALGLEITK